MDENDLACFRCGQIGHLRANCPQARPVPVPRSHDRGVPPRRPGVPPTVEYLHARAILENNGAIRRITC